MVFLGFGKYARADKIFALEPIRGDERGDGRRTRVWVEGVANPIVASRTERTILHDMGEDAAAQAVVVDEALDLARRLATAAEAGRVDLERYLEPASPREIVARVLRNLKGIYLKARKLEQALAVMQRMLLVVPESAEELRDRGLVYAGLDCFRPALADLQNYLRRRPEAADATEMHAKVVELRAAAARLQ